MKFRSEHYFVACQERIEAARRLHNDSRFAAAIYFAGLAVECLLRAYRARESGQFDARHDLGELLMASGIAKFIPTDHGREFARHFATVWARWKNDYRFASDARLRAELWRIASGSDRVRGDFLKYSSGLVLESALSIINIGVLRWPSRKK